MNQAQWEAAAALDWRQFYPVVEAEVKVYLTRHDATAATTELVEALWPGHWPSPVKLRARMFKALTALETRGLARWVTVGEPSRLRGGLMARRRRWHTPQEDQE